MLNSAEIEKTLKTLKLKIEKTKDLLADAKAQKKILLSTLKRDFEAENIMEAENLILKLNKDIEKLEIEIETKYTTLKAKANI